jgi:elongator complex protein 3
MKKRGTACQCVRCREVREKVVEAETLQMDDLTYQVGTTEEHFISFVTPDDGLAGFIRLSLPVKDSAQTGMAELDGAALIREVHVYGQSLAVGAEQTGAAQHLGLGTRLLIAADRVARKHGFSRMAVIAAIGTRHYYLDRGFERGEYYLTKRITDEN